VNFGSDADADSGSRPDSPWRRSALRVLLYSIVDVSGGRTVQCGRVHRDCVTEPATVSDDVTDCVDDVENGTDAGERRGGKEEEIT